MGSTKGGFLMGVGFMFLFLSLTGFYIVEVYYVYLYGEIINYVSIDAFHYGFNYLFGLICIIAPKILASL